MEQLRIAKDNQNLPVMFITISQTEIDNLKKAVINHPKYTTEDDEEGDRFRVLANEKEDWDRLTQMNVADLKEAVNKYIQDKEGMEDLTNMNILNDELNKFRKTLVHA